jgi:uncharacterized membrane protein
MKLPQIELPNIELPFDVPALIHPLTDHFAIVLPVVVLLLEVYNLFVKRKSIGIFSFTLLTLTVVAFVAAYFSGVVDGKEAYDHLSGEGQTALKEHKLLGTYLLFGSAALVLLKLLSLTGKKPLKILFFLGLIGFIVVTFKQGKEGGELVYKYGANVEKVKALDDKLFDAQEALEDSQAKSSEKNISKDPAVNIQKKEESKEAEVVKADEDSRQKESVKIEEKTQESEEKIKNIEATIETSLKEIKKEIEESTHTPSVKSNESEPLEDRVNRDNPNSLNRQDTTNAPVDNLEREEVKLNPVPNSENVTSIPKTPSVPEPIKVNESEESLVTKAGETIKDAVSKESMKGYKDSLEELAKDMKGFFDNK